MVRNRLSSPVRTRACVPSASTRSVRAVRLLPSVPPARPHRASALARAHAPGGLAAVLLLLLCVLVLPAAPAGGEGAGRWMWPVGPPRTLVRPFEAPPHRYGPGHRGIDVSAPDGTVRAVEDGTVRFAGSVAGRPVLSILHADGLLSTYEPVVAVVAAGDAVTAGQVVGHLGDGEPHCAQGPCLHLGARRGEDYLDPLLLLGERGPSVLLPLAGGTSASGTSSAATSGAVTPGGAEVAGQGAVAVGQPAGSAGQAAATVGRAAEAGLAAADAPGPGAAAARRCLPRGPCAVAR